MYEHVRGVATLARSQLGGREVVVALLHDTIEKGGARRELLMEHGFGPAVVDLVEMLTQAPEETTQDYLARCAADPTAAVLKKLDLIEKIAAARRIEDEAKRRRASWEKRLELLLHALDQQARTAR
jgi:(p)ppGpp synthase/HD superfamily hydrolase